MKLEKLPRQQLFGFTPLRNFSNKIAGRKKVLEENLDAQDAINLVRTIDFKRLENIKFYLSVYVIGVCKYKKPTPEKVTDFLDDIIKRHYNASEKDAFATHQIYTDGFRKEKHYLDITLIRKDTIFSEFSGSVRYVLSLKWKI